uniref:Uncharacterized protein n=1 Tax=Oryza rufipogon TaxID=4529 RepID=A0A0E0MZY9_ORYRU
MKPSAALEPVSDTPAQTSMTNDSSLLPMSRDAMASSIPEKSSMTPSEGEALRELDAAHDGEREEAVEGGHEAGDAEEEEDGGDGEAGGHDLRDGEVRGGERDGGDGLHGLDRHGDAEEEPGGEVVERGEDERGAEVEVGRERQRQHDGDVGAQIAHRAAQLRPHRRLEPYGGRDEPAGAVAGLAGEERVAGGGCHGDGTNNIMDDAFCTYVFARWIASNENNGRDKDVK